MKRRVFFTVIPRIFLVGVVSVYGLKADDVFIVDESVIKKEKHEKDPCEILKEIYKEVKELGKYPTEDFIKRTFHINLDGDESNKEEHVVVLSHKVGDKERMIVQVTYFEYRSRSSIVKHPKEIRTVLCYIKGDNLEIAESDYDEKEIRSLLPEILQGIRNKKKLLKLIQDKR